MDFLLSNILLLTTFFLLISHFPIYGLAPGRKEFHIIADCAFHLDEYSFNLCPLAGIAIAATKYSRDIIIDNGTKLEVPPTSCDSDSWVCMTADGHHFLAKNKLRQNLKAQGVSVARRRTNSQFKDEESIKDALHLTLDGGEAEGSAEIEIVCDFNVVESYLEFINERDGIHSFRWTTPHGCPTTNNIKRSWKLFATTTTDDESESEEEKGDDELLPQSGQSTTRRAIISVVIVIFVLGSALLATYPLIPILSTATIKLRPLGRSIQAFIPRSLLCGISKPFRRSSTQLVEWAEEDTMLREADEESWSGLEFDEFIPLTPNPRYGRGKVVKSYGTTPDVETFEQSAFR